MFASTYWATLSVSFSDHIAHLCIFLLSKITASLMQHVVMIYDLACIV